MRNTSKLSFTVLITGLLYGCLAQEPAPGSEPSATGETHVVDPALEAHARAQVAKPLEDQSAEVQTQFAAAKRLTQLGQQEAIAEALAQVEASIEARKSSGAPADEIERLTAEAVTLRARMGRH